MRSVSRLVIRFAATLLALALAGCSTTAPPPGSMAQAGPDATGPSESQRDIWRDVNDGWVRLVAAESGASAYTQPVKVDPDWLRQTLYDIKLRDQDADENAPPIRVFQVKQLDELVPAIARGLAEAQSDQAVAFTTVARRGGFTFFDPPRVTTGRVFVADGKFNILFGAVADPIEEAARRERVLDTPLGTRETVLNRGGDTVWSRTWGSAMRRQDWVALPVMTSEGRLPPLAESTSDVPQASGSAPSKGKTNAKPEVSGETEKGVAPSPSDSGRRTVRERLEMLKGLYDDGLISEDEYRAERQEVLDEL